MTRLIINSLVSLYFLTTSPFLVFVSMVGDNEHIYKHMGVGLLVIPLVIIPNIIGMIVWKVNGKPSGSYNKWMDQSKSGILVRITSFIFIASCLLMLIKTVFWNS
ncbi:MAG TPA: hypothetical protein VF941_08980 [Clostridia bacterium]